jgi:hypothetical protein
MERREHLLSDQPNTAPADAPLHAAEGLAEQLAHMLHVTSALVRQQRSVDLTGLDERIGRLCAAVLDLPHEQGRTVRPSLKDLHHRLATLIATLPTPPGSDASP